MKNEIKKTVVPQFVAEWFEENKWDLEYEIYNVITEIFSIVSCFFVWTAADIFFFGKNEYKIKSFLYGRLTLAKYQIKK